MSRELDCRMQDTSNLLLKIFSCLRFDPLLTFLLLQPVFRYHTSSFLLLRLFSLLASPSELVSNLLKWFWKYCNVIKAYSAFWSNRTHFRTSRLTSDYYFVVLSISIFQYIITLCICLHCYEEIISYYNPKLWNLWKLWICNLPVVLNSL